MVDGGGTGDPGTLIDPTTPAYALRSGSTWRDPFPMYAALRDRDPVHHVERGDFWVLTRFADVFAAARDPQRFSSAEGLTVSYGERERIGLDTTAPLVMLDPPDHTSFRRLVSRAMTPRRVAPLEDRIRAFVRARLDRWDGRDEVDVVAELAGPLANMVVAHFLGVPERDRPQFGVWTEAIVEASANGDPLAAGARLAELLTYFSDLLSWRRAEPGDDLLSMLGGCADRRIRPMSTVAGSPCGAWRMTTESQQTRDLSAHAAIAPEPDSAEAPLEAILGFAFTMVAGGNDTVMSMIAGSAALLAAHPDQRALLSASATIDPAPLEELFRMVTPVQGLARTTTVDVEIDGVTVPAGRKVLLAYGSANRDPREFGPDAEELRLDREVTRMLSFGSGAHHCLGAAAARLEVRVALEELLDRFPDFTVDVERGDFAPGNYVRRYAQLPLQPGPRRT
jgi:cytochrome P450